MKTMKNKKIIKNVIINYYNHNFNIVLKKNVNQIQILMLFVL